MSDRRWWQRFLELFVMEVHRPDGSAYLMSIDPTGFGECWLPIEFDEREASDLPVSR